MPKINQEEYEVLKELDDKWKWIARDDDLSVYDDKPVKAHSVIPCWDIRTTKNEWQIINRNLFQFIQWEDEEPHNIAELIEGFEEAVRVNKIFENSTKMALKESEETEVKKNIEWLKNEVEKRIKTIESDDISFVGSEYYDEGYIDGMRDVLYRIDQLDEPEPKNITLQDVAHRLWEIPLNSRKYWVEQLNDEFQEGYIVPLGLKTTDGEEQYLTLNGSYFASRRNRRLQQTFATLEEIPEFYRDLAERVL